MSIILIQLQNLKIKFKEGKKWTLQEVQLKRIE